MEILEILCDAFVDTLKTIPFLFLAYLLMEYIEHKSSEKMELALQKIGPFSPAVASLLGCVPQCGFSASASNLYTAGIISEGALVAVFLATSDEAVPVLLSEPSFASSIWKVLLCKVAVALICGFALDFSLRVLKIQKKSVELCQKCGCEEESSIWKPAVKHTLKIALFILIINLFLGFAMYFIGEETLSKILLQNHWLQPFACALFGLIPNCAVSVLLARLYIAGSLSFGSMIAGLCSGAGVGLAVLLRTNPIKKENIRIIAILYFVSAIFGLVLTLF